MVGCAIHSPVRASRAGSCGSVGTACSRKVFKKSRFSPVCGGGRAPPPHHRLRVLSSGFRVRIWGSGVRVE